MIEVNATSGSSIIPIICLTGYCTDIYSAVIKVSLHWHCTCTYNSQLDIIGIELEAKSKV